MRSASTFFGLGALMIVAAVVDLPAPNPPPAGPQTGQKTGQQARQRGGAPGAPGQRGQPGQRGGGGRGRGAIAVMTLTSAWPDGGTIPMKHSQAGRDVSPPLSWENAPDNTTSFVLMVHDPDAAV